MSSKDIIVNTFEFYKEEIFVSADKTFDKVFNKI